MVEQKCLLRPAVVRLAQKPGQEDRMTTIDYIGFDIHKRTISFCAKAQDGTILEEGTIPALRNKLLAWAKVRPRPWMGAMEATLFTGWIYDLLKPLAQASAGNPPDFGAPPAPGISWLPAPLPCLRAPAAGSLRAATPPIPVVATPNSRCDRTERQLIQAVAEALLQFRQQPAHLKRGFVFAQP
jgi:hypothetical protein